jgi:hypothetical protein
MSELSPMNTGLNDIVLDNDQTQKLVTVLHSQHALMGIWGNVFDRLGGEQFLFEWAQDNPTKYLTMLTRMVPTLAPSQGIQGDINIRISNDLPRGALDD